MKFSERLRELIAQADHTPLYIRYCDDSYFQSMTVLSTKDWGDRNTGVFDDEPDTVAIIFHQLCPSVGCDSRDFNKHNARLLVELWNKRNAILALVEAVSKMREASNSSAFSAAVRAVVAKHDALEKE
jgi:hypothetical protein